MALLLQVRGYNLRRGVHFELNKKGGTLGKKLPIMVKIVGYREYTWLRKRGVHLFRGDTYSIHYCTV